MLKHGLGRTIKSFNPRARDGRECFNDDEVFYKVGFNPRARDGREFLITSFLSR